jgi:outer membrane protein assembly factor BamD
VRQALLVLGLILGAAACAGKKDALPADPAQADRFLMDRGNETLAKHKWMQAREYFRQIVDNYPQSSFRADAKLGIGEAYLGEGTAESLVLAGNEFREFLTFYRGRPRADFAQYNLAMTHFKQMRAPDRDQTPTKEALTEFDAFFQQYPTSPLMAEVKDKWRVARDRLSTASYLVGVGYFKRGLVFSAIPRFREIITDDPGFSKMDGVYYYLAESLTRSDKKAEALPLFARVVEDYKTSEHLEKAQKRLQELKAQ